LIKAPKGQEIDSQSLFELGLLYERGDIPKFPRNLAMAFSYFKDVADKKYISAYSKLATIYYLGENSGYQVQQDNELTIKYSRLSADAGSAEGMVLMGQIYMKGLGSVEKNLGEARNWFNKAMEKGDIMAPYFIGRLYTGDVPDTPTDYPEAIKWLKISSEKGNIAATYELGAMYLNHHTGEPTPPVKGSERYYNDLIESEKYFIKASAVDSSFPLPDEIIEFQKK